MNINNLIQNPKIKYFYYFILLLPFIILPILLSNTNFKTKKNTSTVPLIPSNSQKIPTNEDSSQNYQNPFGSEQKITFNWNNISPTLPASMDVYKIVTPIINTSTITSLANKFNFTINDKSSETSEGSNLWISKTANLFGSTKQNQIFYFYTTPIPKHTANISKEESITITKQTVSELLGSNFANNLNTSPEVRFLNIKPNYIEDQPDSVNETDNNIITVNYKQDIDGLPVVSRSRNSEILSISIDTTKKIYALNLYGGFDTVKKIDTLKTINFSELKEIADKKAIRISHSKDMSSERIFTDSKEIKVLVDNVYPGYFQNDNSSIYPVFIIEGTMSTNGTESYPAIYIVLSNKN